MIGTGVPLGGPPGIVDLRSRQAIEFSCPLADHDGELWHDMESASDDHVEEVIEALRWFQKRGDATCGFRVVNDGNRPNLIRFEEH